MNRPSDTAGMEAEDTTVYKNSGPNSSAIINKTNAELLAEANSGKYAPDDPLAGRIPQDDNIPGFYTGDGRKQVTRISSEVDPVFSKTGFTIGDRIYHKEKHCEGKVIDLMASGSVIVKLDNGKKGTTSAKNLVKL